MKNTFEPFKNKRHSRNRKYQSGGTFHQDRMLNLYSSFTGELYSLLCKNCKHSLGEHIVIEWNKTTNCPPHELEVTHDFKTNNL